MRIFLAYSAIQNSATSSGALQNTSSSSIDLNSSDLLQEIATPTPVFNLPSGILIKRVGSDLTTRTAPAGISAHDGGYEATVNSLTLFQNIEPGNHAVNTTFDSQYELSVATCEYPINTIACTITDPSLYTPVATSTQNGYAGSQIFVKPGMITKVVFRYIKPKFVIPKTAVKIQFVGFDNTTATAPAGAKAGIALFPNQLSIQPFLGTQVFSLPAGTLGFVATNTPISGYKVSAGICQYSGTSADCMPASYSQAACTSNICSLFLPYASNIIQKVVYKYDTDAQYAISPIKNEIMMRNASTTIPVTLVPVINWTSSVTLSMSGLPANVQTLWNTASCTPHCVMKLSIITSTTTPIGRFPITITGSSLSQTAKFDLVVTEK